jgi:hypothetical protein
MRARRRAAVVGGVLGAALAGAGPAPAATIVTGVPCYRDGGEISIAGEGFIPGALVTVSGTGIAGQAFADGSGTVQLTASAQPLHAAGPAVRTVNLIATDGTTTVHASVRITNFTFAITPAVRRPSTPVRWAVSGFDDATRVYAHYVHDGRERRRVLFGRMPSPCSVLHARVPMLPVAHPEPGRWIIQLDNQPRYRPTTLPRLRLSGRIRSLRG